MGFWSDLGDAIFQKGKDEVSSRFSAHYGSDHIQAQNDTVAYMGQVLDAVHANYFTIDEGVDAINKAVFSFAQLANRFGERGRRGASEVTALGADIVRNLRGGQVPAPGGGYQPGGFFPPSVSSENLLLVGGGAVLLFLLFRRKGR